MLGRIMLHYHMASRSEDRHLDSSACMSTLQVRVSGSQVGALLLVVP